MIKNLYLQPWLDYFSMLRRYAAQGYLEMAPDKHEAYITLPALLSLAPTDDPLQALKSVPETVTGIRAYAAFLNTAAAADTAEAEGTEYLGRPFAIHVVEPDLPHNLLYTLLITKKRTWRHPLTPVDSYEVIEY